MNTDKYLVRRHFFRGNIGGTGSEPETAAPTDLPEFIMPSVPPTPLPRFASLVPDELPRLRWRIAQLFAAPFRDVDDRVARKAAAARARREARGAAMSGGAPRDR